MQVLDEAAEAGVSILNECWNFANFKTVKAAEQRIML